MLRGFFEAQMSVAAPGLSRIIELPGGEAGVENMLIAHLTGCVLKHPYLFLAIAQPAAPAPPGCE